MKRNLVLASVMALAITGGSYGVAFAQDNPTPECGAALSSLVDARSDLSATQKAYDALPDTVPNPDLAKLQDAVTKAQADFDSAKAPVVEYNPNVYPNDTVPALTAINVDLLNKILADPDLGGDARGEVENALAKAQALGAAKQSLADAPKDVPNPALKDSEQLDNLNAAKDEAKKAQDVADKACEGQKGDPGPVVVVPPAQNPPAANPPVVGDKDCKDFATQADAQKALTEGDPFNLDSDKDGQACEEFFTPNPPTANQPQVQQVPVGGVETGDGSLA